MSQIPDAQGTVVNWRGAALGNLVGFKVDAPAAASSNVTLLSAPRVGSGGNVRVARQTTTLMLEPVIVEIAFLGVPVLQTNDRGQDGPLVLTFPGGGVSGNAMLKKFEIDGSVGALTQTVAQFEFSNR